MKTSDINKLVDSVLKEEIMNAILKENNMNSEVYHIKHDGEPVDTFDDVNIAKENLNIYKQRHPDKEFIIEKSRYDSHSDMVDKLDGMGEQLEQNENNMEKSPVKAKNIHEAITFAKEKGYKKVKINEEIYDVEECWNELNEGSRTRKHSYTEDKNTKDDNIKDEKSDKEGDEKKVVFDMEKKPAKKDVNVGKSFDKFKKEVDESDEEDCMECEDTTEEEVKEETEMCETCGKEKCECTIKESKAKSIRITESQLVQVIGNLVKESESVPGLAITKRAQAGSKKENDKNAADVGKKIKDYLDFDGNDHPEFPKAIGKGEKVAINNTKEEDEIVTDNRGRGMENLVFDHKPSKKFKERSKGSLEGDSKMGNAQETEKLDTKEISNGAKPKAAPKGTDGIPVKTDTGKKLNAQIPKKEKAKKDEPVYNRERVPVKTIKEDKLKFSTVIEEELNRMNRIVKYNQKTQ